jgi:hypothetical protein
VWAWGIEIAGVETLSSARSGEHVSVRGARILAFAVDDHAAGKDESAVETALVQRLEQHGRPQIVVPHVPRDIAEADAEPHHRRLMAHGVDAFDTSANGVEVAQVLEHVVGCGVEVGRL